MKSIGGIVRLRRPGVGQGGVKDTGSGSGFIVEFRGPDNIALELFAPRVSTSSTTG
jgi:hypothetical protein